MMKLHCDRCYKVINGPHFFISKEGVKDNSRFTGSIGEPVRLCFECSRSASLERLFALAQPEENHEDSQS